MMIQASKRLLIVLIIIGMTSTTGLYSQSWGGNNTGEVLLLGLGYGAQRPGGDLADRFGNSFSPEVVCDYMTNNNWVIGIHGQYFFGNTVKEDVLSGLRTSAGYIIGNDRDPADIQLRERAWYVGLRLGKLISLDKKNTRSGLRIDLGAGLLQHRIRMQKDPFRIVPQIEDEYGKGYDRLTNGPALYQFVGYQYMGKNNGINVTVGVEMFEAFTQNRRTFNFDTMESNTATRLDILSGLRATFYFPIFLGNAEDVYY